MVLFSRSDIGHSYRSSAYASEGASNWLENADVGNTTPLVASTQMEGFVVSGCNSRVKKAQGGMYNILFLAAVPNS
jgi:hypothetical protein